MDRIQKRFDELNAEADAITNHPNDARPLIYKWESSVLSLIERVFGRDTSVHHDFKLAKERPRRTSPPSFSQMYAVFLSAKEQFEGGYLFDVRNLVHAEVFTDELDQARHFLKQGHRLPAAVIAGTVLESTLRTLCSQHPAIQLNSRATINPMNDDLAREEVYNLAKKQQITAWAAIRNDAAHGKPEFRDHTNEDIERMIDGIGDFVANHMK